MRPIRTLASTALAASAACAALLAVAAPAQATPPASDNVTQVIAVVGSDTTYDFVQTYSAAWAADATHNPSPNPDTLQNIAPGAASATIPADAECAGQTLSPAPNGSSAGRDALFAAGNQATACIDIARSSSQRRSSDPAAAEYWAFARDAVSVVTWGSAQINITVTDLRSIYSCAKTDWSDIAGSGKTGTIVRYLPQTGSGTRDFFIATLLGGVNPAADSATCPLRGPVQENNATLVAPADQAAAILPYSAGKWVVQKRTGGSADLTAGSFVDRLNNINPITGSGASLALNATAINATINPFPGRRYLYNVLWSAQPAAQYTAARRVVGVQPGAAAGQGTSKLCDGTSASSITAAGFVPLSSGVTDPANTAGYPNSTCRRNVNN